ncbi:Soluble epoxide hydrolase [Marinibacterium anthonyi]|nr:Soluble epoxide hydrolase [Marinibacterium anthonyi]
MITETCLLNDRPFFLRRWGDATLPPLLLLHGFPEYGGAWEDLAPRLAHRFHCVAPDQRGYGQSWSPRGVDSYRAAHLVADMAALIDHLGGQAIVFGHDWGAAVAYGLAIRHPGKVSRLIVANGVHPAPFQRELARGGAQSEASQYIDLLRAPGSQDRLAANGFAGLIKLFSAHMDLSWLTPARQAKYVSAWSEGGGRLGTMIDWYRASPLRVAAPGVPITDLPDMPPDRLRVACPHLLIWGRKDTALLPQSTEGLEAYAPDLTRVELADADHWVCHQRPEQVAGAVLDWT